MKTNDPRLTAFTLGELNAEDSRAVQQAIQNDEYIAKEVAAIEEMTTLVNLGYSSEELKLNTHQRGKVFAAGKQTPPSNISSFKPKTWIPWASAGIAAAIAILVNFSQPHDTASQSADYSAFPLNELSEGIALSNMPWKAPNEDKTPELNPSPITQALAKSPQKFRHFLSSQATNTSAPIHANYQESSWMNSDTRNSTELPLTSGNLSWEWVKQAIDNRQKIRPGIIRTEEILNTTPLPFSSDFSVDDIVASTSLVPSPWNTNSVIAVINLKNSSTKPVKGVTAAISFHSAVKQFRVLGYRDSSAVDLYAPSFSTLNPGYAHTLLCELDFGTQPTAANPLLTLHLATKNNSQNATYAFSELASENPTPTARFSVALAYWSQWAGKSNATINATTEDVKTYLENAASQIKDNKAKEMAASILSSM